MDDDSYDPDPYDLPPRPEPPTLKSCAHAALLEDLAAVLHAHGYPPLTGYALVELTSSLYRL